MNKPKGYATLAVLIMGTAFAGVPKANLDFSAIERIWKIAAILAQEKEPAEAEWSALFQTPGYRELMSHEPYFREENFKVNFRLAFLPSKAAARKEALEKRPNSTAAHFVRIGERQEELRRLQAELETGALMDAALEKTRGFLPAGATDKIPSPPISFIFFAPDGRGYDPIVIDLLHAANQGDGLADFLAHEAHHYLRNKLQAYDEGDLLVVNEFLLNGLNQLQAEGIADQIDKHGPYFRKTNPEASDYADVYRKNVLDSPRILAEVNRRLEEAADRPGRDTDLLDIAPQSGHPTGYFMARTIIDGGGEREMIDTIGNPFAFIYLYNRAAMKSGTAPLFSRKAVEYLKELERTYCRKPETALFLEAVSGGFDPSAIETFWKIADQLAQGQDPSPDEWVRLTGHPAYAELAAHEGAAYEPDVVKDRMELAFKPSRAEELQAAQKQGRAGMAGHFASLKSKRAAVDAYLKSLETENWIGRIMADVRPYLPAELLETNPKPLFTPVFFSPDLRYGYAIFIFDPSYGGKDPAVVEYYARFFVLYYYRDFQTVYDYDRLKVKHAEAVRLFGNLERFGFMENIRPGNSHYDGDPARKETDRKAFEAGFKDAPALLARLDRTLTDIGTAGGTTQAWAKLSFRDFPLEGRPLGYFMARTIEERLGKERLIVTLGNPFAFIRLYNEAAAKGPASLPRFGKAAIELIGALEKEYGRETSAR